MKTDNTMVLIFLSFLAVARCTDLQPLTSSDEENRVEQSNGLTVGIVGGGDDLNPETSAGEPTTTTAAVDGHRSGRQFYQPAAAFAYQPYPQRRAYKKSPGPPMKRPKFRTKPGSGRRGLRPRRRPSGPPPMSGSPLMSSGSRFRRLPAPMMRPQHVNYIDTSGGVDYDDGFESAPLPMSSFDYGDLREFDHEQAAAATYAYGPPLQAASSSGRSRKRPASIGYAEETRPTAIVHVPMRVVRPVAPTPLPPPAGTTGRDASADPMEKLRQLVHEAMDEHFASRHQELYGDGFDKRQPDHQQQNQPNAQPVYSAKYSKRQQVAATEKTPTRGHQQRTADAVKSAAVTKDDVDADGSDDRLTLAEISAYMGAKPAETVLSAGGHRYVLSDALQQSYRHQLQNHQLENQQLRHHQQYGGDSGEDHQSQYLRYVSPFEGLYELPAARWTYK